MNADEAKAQDVRLADSVRGMLSSLRARIRRYVWIEGAAATIACLCLAFWTMIAVDWLFEPSRVLRWALLGAGLAAAAWCAYRLLVRRLSAPLRDTNLALLIERYDDRFHDSLMTAVSLADRGAELSPTAREMLVHTCDEAAQRARDVRLKDLLDPAPLTRAVAVGGLLALSVGLFALVSPQAFGFGVNRLLGRTDELWPRRTGLEVDGFENGERVVARGEDVQIVVRANTSMPLVPESVQIRYRTEDGDRGRETMSREGNAVPGKDPFQEYRHAFSSLLTSRTFDVLGGDARIRDLRIRVVESPTLSDVTLHCSYPAYMGRSPRDIAVTGVTQLPIGVDGVVRAVASKDLTSAEMTCTPAGGEPRVQTIALGRADPRTVQFPIGPVTGDMTLAFTLHDRDGIYNRRPFVVTIAAVADEPPRLAVRLDGIGTAVTPQARLPLVGKISDDHGLSATEFETVINEGEPRRAPFAAQPRGAAEVTVDEQFEVAALELQVGQRLFFGAAAADNYRLAESDAPHSSASDRFQLEVVAPDTLRAMLESRELNLRQQFETLIDEVAETRDSLARITWSTAAAADEKDQDASTDDASGATDDADDPAANVRARNDLLVQRAEQNSRKNAQETLGVASSFDGIRAEMVNNRIDTEELRVRLEDYIAVPLRQVANEMFPEWDRRLGDLRARLGASDDDARRAALAQADAILVEMQAIRDKMLELESFNEFLALYREIVEKHEDLRQQTDKERKESLSDLLEE